MTPANAIPSARSLPTKKWEFPGWSAGVNTFKLATELKGNELASALNGELYGKSSLRPRRGGERLGGSLGGNSVDGLFQYKEGESVNHILGISNGILKKYNSATDAWDTISGASFEVDLRTRATKLRSNLYFGNKVDPFTRYNGSILQQFSGVSAPTSLAVNPQGTTGTAAYEYTVTTVTSKGQSLPATNVSITNGNETLDGTNFNRVTFDKDTDSEVIGYNVFGRKTTGTGVTLMTFIDQPGSGATITFDDDGTISPTTWLPPDGDSTDGITCEIWDQLRGSLIGVKNPDEPHRLFYTGTGDKYESLSPAHNGGWVDIRRGDNDAGINGLAPFESKMIVPKETSIHQFYFSSTTGDAIVQELISYVGCGAPGSMVVMENDIAFIDSERKFRILGYEPNFQAAIRTTSLSEGRTQSLFNEIDSAYLSNCEAVYHDGRYLLAATGAGSTYNNMVIPYDRRYLSFLGKWTGKNCNVRCWLVWDGKDGRRRLFAGASDEDSVFEVNVEGKLTDHDNSAVITRIKTRTEDHDNSGQQKIYKWADLRVYRIQGVLKLTTILDGANVLDTKPFTSRISTGWGIKQWGSVQWGVSTGTGASASDLDKTLRKELYELANSLGFEVAKDGAEDDFILVSMRGESFILPTEVFNSENII